MPWFGGHSRAVYEDLCSFEVLAGHSGFRRRDELRNDFREKEEGGLLERGTGDLVFF